MKSEFRLFGLLSGFLFLAAIVYGFWSYYGTNPHRTEVIGLVALILEGRGSDLIGSEMRREALQGAIVSLTLIFGIPVLRSFGPEETARAMIVDGLSKRITA